MLGSVGCDSAIDTHRLEGEARLGSKAQAVAGATCVTFQRGANGSVADARVSSRQPSRNFDGEPVASVSHVNGQHEHLLLRFDTSSLPRQATVTSATLTLWQTNSGRPTALRAHAITHPWQEGSVTWQGFGSAYDASVAASVEGAAQASVRTLELPSLVATWVKEPSANHGLLLEQAEDKTVLATSESPHAGQRPRLEVCYTEPPEQPDATLPSGTSLLLQVVDSVGNPIPAAAVSTQAAVFPTDSSGHLLLEELPAGRFSARVDALGFTSASVVVDLHEGAHVGYQARLLPLGNPLPFQAEQGATLETPQVRVTIPPGAVVDALGQPVTGPVEMTIAPLDPTTQLANMPGPLEATRQGGGGTVELESLFMAEVSLWSNGAPVQLSGDATATVEFVLPDALASQVQVGESIPAWWLDLEAGVWREEGAGIVQASQSQPGKLVWVVQVKHFTWWNCDKPWTDKSCVDVLVVDERGQPVPNAQVTADGVSYSGSSGTRYTGPEGRTCIEIKRGNTANIYGGLRNQPATAVVQVTGTEQAAVCGTGPCTPVTLVLEDVICTPGAYEECPYSGTPGTVIQGLCRTGRRQCNLVGTAWSQCQGEVLPAPESCQNTFDDDCDGQVNEDCSCTDQQGITCYGGPAGTQGVGICHSGTVGCDMFGNVACVGQQVPKWEDCSTLADDDCDGANECQPAAQWFWKSNNTQGWMYPESMAVDGESNTLMLGRLNGTVELAGTQLFGDLNDRFLVKLDASGQPAWALHIDENQWPYYSWNPPALATDAAGNVVVSKHFSGAVSLGGQTFSTTSQQALLVARLSPAGQLLWARVFEGDGASWAIQVDITPDSSGDIFFTGSFQGTLGIGEAVYSAPMGVNSFIAKLDGTTGQPLWSRSQLNTGAWDMLDLELDAAGDVLWTSLYWGGALELDGIQLPFPQDAFYPLTFVAKLAGGSGSALWARSYGTGQTLELYPQLKREAAGNLVMLSWTPMTSLTLRKLDAQGEQLWSRIIGQSTQNFWAYLHEQVDMDIDTAGNILLAGWYVYTMDFGGGVRNSGQAPAAFLAWYDAQGNYLMDKHYPGDWSGDWSTYGYSQGVGAQTDAAGHVLLGGSMYGTIDFGLGPVQSLGDDIFLLKIDPTP